MTSGVGDGAATDGSRKLETKVGAGAAAQLALAALLVLAGWLLLESLPIAALRLALYSWWPLWVPLSALVAWRWSWALTHWLRALLYRYWAYPRLQREAARELAARGPIPEVTVLMVTYRERVAITHAVVGSVVAELVQLEGLARPPLLIGVTGSDDDDHAIREAFAAALARAGADGAVELCLLRGANGKRDALAKGLELLRARAPAPDGVFVMMDGDTELEPGALCRVLPLFRLEPPVAALTTNEHARVRGPSWIGEWLALRHGQRHLYNCSIALSGRLLCLTGRYSVFRAACLEPAFIEIVRNDHVEHWLWGRYKLLSGDDKSTWFHLLRQGSRLLYAPDVCVITHETITGNPLVRAYHNLRRWGGNMVRNSERAIAVGPRRLGWFCWWCLVDQRVSMWTTLIGPTVLSYTLAFRQVELASAYLLWVLCSRFVRAVPAFFHGRRLSAFYAPLAVVFDWSGAAIKLWVACFPARQFWQNRSSADLDSTRSSARVLERRGMAGLALACMLVVFAVAVGQLIGVVRPALDFAFIRHELASARSSTLLASGLIVLLALAFALRLAPPRPLPPPESSRAH